MAFEIVVLIGNNPCPIKLLIGFSAQIKLGVIRLSFTIDDLLR
jgi:hypothetical protein